MTARRSKGSRPWVLKFTATNDERAAIRTASKADGMAVGAWLATVAMAAAGKRHDPAREAEARERLAHLDTMRSEMASAGNNLNQIARAVNTGEPVGVGYAGEVYEMHLEQLDELARLMESYRRWLRR